MLHDPDRLASSAWPIRPKRVSSVTRGRVRADCSQCRLNSVSFLTCTRTRRLLLAAMTALVSQTGCSPLARAPGHLRRTCWCLGLTRCVRCQMHLQSDDMIASNRGRPALGDGTIIKVALTARPDQYVCASQFRLIHPTRTLAQSFIFHTPMARFRLRSWFKSRPGKHCC